MNHIEVFRIAYSKDIESEVNEYCRVNMLNPISISVCLEQSFHTTFIVSVVVEPIKEAWE